MAKKICIPSDAAAILSALETAGFEAYIVGGCVRDSLLGQSPSDWDICTSALPSQVNAALRNRGFQIKPTGLKHGTVSAIRQSKAYEITTYRTESEYVHHRAPRQVQFTSKLHEDLRRRDFTVNALAYHPRKGFIDLFGGQKDLDTRTLRCVGDADLRFDEDALRILRALRFCSVYGFRPEPLTAQALHKNKPLLEHISVERVYAELKKMLCGEHILSVLLEDSDILGVILPEIQPCVGFCQHSPYHIYDVWEHTAHAVDAVCNDVILRLCMLLHDLGKPDMFSMGSDRIGHFYAHARRSRQIAINTLRRLHAEHNTLQTVPWLILHHMDPLPQNEILLRKRLSKWGVDAVLQWLQIKKADAAAHAPETNQNQLRQIDQIRAQIETWLKQEQCFSLKQLALNGNDLISAGVSPGPNVGYALNFLLQQVIQKRLPNEATVLLKHIPFSSFPSGQKGAQSSK